MTNNELKSIISEWVVQITTIDVLLKEIHTIFGVSHDSKLINAIYDLQVSYTYFVEKLINNENETLQWYWLENNMGRNSLKYDHLEKVDDLIEILRKQ